MLRSLANSGRALHPIVASRSLSTTSSYPQVLHCTRDSHPSTKMAPIERITLFKIPKEEDRLRLLEQYKVLAKTATKDGKPYILSAAVGLSFDDPRNKGYNVSVKTTFASLEDMKYYDTECEAHAALKAVAGPIKEDVLTTYYENVL
ncbi:hypothetical protein F1880_001572 [Penicillium rolfsii]|nr:hypothetical protein F1880_001572 [Penicillium rolfsii]